MKLLMPSHAKRIKHYADPVPLFQRYGAEDQLTAMYDPVVQLKRRRLSRDQPDRGARLDRHQLGPFDQGARDRGDRASAPTLKPRARSPASCACATWPGLS